MTVIHKKCKAVVVTTHPKTGAFSDGDWGWCSKCYERVDHLIYLGYGNVAISDEVRIDFN